LYATRETADPREDGAVLVLGELYDPSEWNFPEFKAKWVWWLSCRRHYPLEAYRGWGHLFQSEYARLLFEKIGLSGFMLTDHIRPDFFESPPAPSSKKDLIIFSGSRSALNVLRLKLTEPRLRLMPLRGLGAPQIVRRMDEAKIYLDMGLHTGRDRLPREAALRGCLVVMPRQGAAAGPADVPIPDEYRWPAGRVAGLGDFLRRLLKEYDERVRDFSGYRDWIGNQRAAFQKEVRHFSEVCRDVRPPAVSPAEKILPQLDAQVLELEESLGRLKRESADLAVRVENVLMLMPLKVRLAALLNAAVGRLRRPR